MLIPRCYTALEIVTTQMVQLFVIFTTQKLILPSIDYYSYVKILEEPTSTLALV